MPKSLNIRHHRRVGPDALFERPNLAVHVSVILAMWATIEESVDRILINMSGSDIYAIASMYYAVGSFRTRMDVLRALAKTRLSKEGIEDLNKLIEALRKPAKERAKFAHCSWGISDAFPDALIMEPPFWDLRKKPMAYVEKDFLNTEKRFVLLDQKVRRFLLLLAPGQPQGRKESQSQ